MQDQTPSLVQIQHDFLVYLQQQDATIRSLVSGTEKVGVTTRLGIYANAYSARLLETLQEHFPGLHTLLGDEAFSELAQHYIDKHPSRHFSLRYFGHQLAGLLRKHPAYAQQPVLTEMAEFEWSVWTAFDAPDSVSADLDSLRAIPAERWGDLCFKLHPSCQLLDLKWNVPALWQAIQEAAGPIAPEQADYPVVWLIWRQALQTFFRALEVDEAWALLQVQQQTDFSALCEGICEWVEAEHAPARIVSFLQGWLEDGLVEHVYLK